jgi:neutral ceramidase
MIAGAAKRDITPSKSVWMDGMIRDSGSTGVHDHIWVRALALANGDVKDGIIVVSTEICGVPTQETTAVREKIAAATGIPVEGIIVADTHTHSGPAAYGFFDVREEEYAKWLNEQIYEAAVEAAANCKPATLVCARGEENTISHYRRLLGKNGKVIMNWEPYTDDDILGPLGVPDPGVGVLKVVAADDPSSTIAVLFNHTGHPNVMDGSNLLISGDYPGMASRLLEEAYGTIALFVNGAQGSSDIDGLRDRDWEGVTRTGTALADAVKKALSGAGDCSDQRVRFANTHFTVPKRRISDEEYAWALKIVEETGGKLQPLVDGVGDDYKALLCKRLRESSEMDIPIEINCFAIGDYAFVTNPGELYTEIGLEIKSRSPFPNTFIIGMANGYMGYIPTAKAIIEGGYAEDTRRVNFEAAEIIVDQTLKLLQKVSSKQ